uniref:Lgl_C domain-containing protein n=1 Tax=Steinernema glaseri TaxID=37863 RepID=A0A1I7YJ83_9BILA
MVGILSYRPRKLSLARAFHVAFKNKAYCLDSIFTDIQYRHVYKRRLVTEVLSNFPGRDQISFISAMHTMFFVLISAMLLASISDVQAGFFSRGYVNYLMNRHDDHHVVPVQKERTTVITNPLSSIFSGPHKGPIHKLPQWLIIADQPGNVKVFDPSHNLFTYD